GGISPEGATLNTERMVLSSERVLKDVVETLALTEDPEFVPTGGSEPGFLRASIERLTGLPALLFRQVAGRGAGAEEQVAVAGEGAAGEGATGPVLQAINALRGKMQVAIVPNTYVLAVEVVTTAPSKSSAIANGIAKAYVEGQVAGKYE